MEYRIEKDTMGEIKVPADKYWGAQTQRSKENFKIGAGTMPIEIIRAFAYLKKAAALANVDLKVLPEEKGEMIARVCDGIIEGKLDDNFPLDKIDSTQNVPLPTLSCYGIGEVLPTDTYLTYVKL